MKIFLVQYDYSDDRDGRMVVVDEHKSYMRELGNTGINVVSGARGADETPGAVLIFRAPDREAAEALTDKDPFVRDGFVIGREVMEFIPMSGELATEIQG